MLLAELIERLSSPEAYPFPVTHIEVRQTHISVVFLVKEFVYKIKKPVSLGFLDFSTLEKRKFYCEEEVRLNRRFAKSIYLGVIPIIQTSTGPQIEGIGEPIEYAVKMLRLPESATLLHHVKQGTATSELMEQFAYRLVDFHRQADRNESISHYGSFEIVAQNARENFQQTTSHQGKTVHTTVYERLKSLTEESLIRLRPILEQRVKDQVICDTHGDLHLDHVYWFPNQLPPEDLFAIDCIEFNERFRFADPISDMAFLNMDLKRHGRRDLALRFANAYFEASLDEDGVELVPFYTAYRAIIRAKVDGMKASEFEIPEKDKQIAQQEARVLWLLALQELEIKDRKPMIVLIGGLPGTGKSTVAKWLAKQAHFEVLRTDVIRKELTHSIPKTEELDSGIYSPEWTDGTYRETARRAEDLIYSGKRVIIDASFRERKHRKIYIDLANHWGIPIHLVESKADETIVQQRLRHRVGDASDADFRVYQYAKQRWEPWGIEEEPQVISLWTNEGSECAAKCLLTQLGSRSG